MRRDVRRGVDGFVRCWDKDLKVELNVVVSREVGDVEGLLRTNKQTSSKCLN